MPPKPPPKTLPKVVAARRRKPGPKIVRDGPVAAVLERRRGIRLPKSSPKSSTKKRPLSPRIKPPRTPTDSPPPLPPRTPAGSPPPLPPRTPAGSPPKTPAKTPPKKPERDWDSTKKQGSVGFNEYATRKMREAGLVFTSTESLACPVKGGGFKPSPPQAVVQYLVHPETTVDRFLIAHRTGLGKTFSLILALDNFYDDPRAKCVVFPNQKVTRNFYTELMVFPSRYRDFVVAMTGLTEIKSAADMQRVVDTLALSGVSLQSRAKAGDYVDAANKTIKFPAAPLRALRYTVAGGAQVFRKEKSSNKQQWSRPENMLFRWRVPKSEPWQGRNPLSNMIMLFDELHNLLHPDPEIARDKQQMARLATLRAGLMSAKNSVIVGATATPVIHSPEDVDAIMKLVRGDQYKDAPTNEGFVSYFQNLPTSVFARVTTGTPLAKLPRVRQVELPTASLQMTAYLQKWKEFKKKYPSKPEAIMEKLHPYSSSGLYKGLGFAGASSRGWQRLLKDREDVAVKLVAVIRDVFDNPVKTLILVHTDSGFAQMQALWKIEAKKREGVTCPGACWLAFGKTDNAKQEAEITKQLEAFNDKSANGMGEKIQVVIADSKVYESGISFWGVRRLILVDVPMTFASYVQRIGRALRFCGHDHLEKRDQTVEIIQYVATSSIIDQTTDEYYFEKLRTENDKMLAALERMHDFAVDRDILSVFAPPPSSVVKLPNISLPRFSRTLPTNDSVVAMDVDELDEKEDVEMIDWFA